MQIKSNTLKGITLFLCSIIILAITNGFMNIDVLALATYIAFLIFIYKTNGQILLKYLFMFVMFSYHIISVFWVENNYVYFYNLQESSYRSGAFLPLLSSYMIFFAVLLILESNSKSLILEKSLYFNKKRIGIKIGNMFLSEKNKIRILTLLLMFSVVFMLFRMRNFFFYGMGGINRFTYRASVFTGLDEKFYTYISWLLPLPLLASNLKMRKRAIAFLAIYCLYMIWVGDKFGSLFMAFYIFILTTWVTRGIDKKAVKKIILIAIIALITLMAFIAFQVLYERGSWNEVLIYFNNRLTGGQSDLWWKIYSSDNNNGWRITEFIEDEISAIFITPSTIQNYNFGIYKMMKIAAPQWVVTNYLNSGIRFAASTQASLFYYFKLTGVYLGSFVLGILCFVFVNKAISAYRNTDIIRSICYTMLISKWYQVMAMSDITMVGNTTTLIAVVVLFYLHFSQQRNAKRNKYKCC